MLQFVFRKVLNKKWMVLALLVGNILLVSIAAASPIYTKAVLQRSLEREINNYISEENEYPFLYQVKVSSTSVMPLNREYQEEIKQPLENLAEEMGLPVNTRAIFLESWPQEVISSTLAREDVSSTIRIATLSDMEDHIKILTGKGFSSEPDAAGVYDVIVSEKAFSRLKLLLNEVLTLEKEIDDQGNHLKIRIAGVFTFSDESDPYWVQTPNAYSLDAFISEDAFNSFYNDSSKNNSLTGVWMYTYDYSNIKSEQAAAILTALQNIEKIYNSGYSFHNYNSFDSWIADYVKTSSKVSVTFLTLQVPILLLLAAFIFMVSSQLLRLEENEISVLKSRGAGKAQIIGIYLIQSAFVSLISFALGIGGAFLLVNVLGSTNSFLEFVSRASLKAVLSEEAILYATAASFFSICTMVLPVIRFSAVSIVNVKQRKHRGIKRPFYHQFFLDVIALGLGLYGLYSFNNQKEILAQKVIEGTSLDPLLFFSSSLFMLGAGLLLLRFIPLIASLIFKLFKKFWSPALYTSFLRIIRTRKEQGFIVAFLVMTIAIGVFDASAARTINRNDEDNLTYSIGADVVLVQNWSSNEEEASEDSSVKLVYREPDYTRFSNLSGAISTTKVLVETNATMSKNSKKVENVQVMGIQTKSFGETANFDETLMTTHWYEYLNTMAQVSDGVLVSSNFATNYGYVEGDIIYYTTAKGNSARGVICGFIDYWPSYSPSIYKKDKDGVYKETENHLIVANLSYLQSVWGVTPYQVWIKSEEDHQYLYDFLEKDNGTFSKVVDLQEEKVKHKNDAILQGTNGILTVGFLVILILCCVGFLIYWILSIKSRELQFSIFRAMGLSLREIISMLLNEHLFISGLPIVIGAVVGYFTSKLYMPLIQLAYSSSDYSLPLQTITESSDQIRLAVIVGLMVLLCLVVLADIIRRCKIAQALKMGED